MSPEGTFWIRSLFTLAVAFGGVVLQAGTPGVMPRIVELWPEGSPNNPTSGPRPILEIFHPLAPEHALPATVIVIPGGGFAGLSPYERL